MTSSRGETPDDYIDLLVREIVGAAGAPDGQPPEEAINRIDLVQAHIEKLREDLHDKLERQSIVSEIEGEVREANRTELDTKNQQRANIQPSLVPDVEPDPRRTASPPKDPGRRSAEVAAARGPVGSKASARVPRSEGADEVILEALEASGSAVAPAAEPGRGRFREAPRRGGGLQLLLLALMLAMIVGWALAMIGNSFYSKITDLLENYWIEEDAVSADVTPGYLDLPAVPTEAPFAGKAPPAASEPPGPRLAPTDGRVTQRLPAGLAENRRTVRTYRVGPDGKIVFGPRVGS